MCRAAAEAARMICIRPLLLVSGVHVYAPAESSNSQLGISNMGRLSLRATLRDIAN